MSIKKKMYFTLALVAIAIGLIAYAILWPTWQEINDVVTAIQRERLDLEEKYQRGQRMKKMTAEYQKIKSLRTRLDTIFIPSGDELSFITTLERLEREYNVEVIPALEGLRDALGPNDPLPLGLTIRGNYESAIRYLIGLERLTYYYNIASVNIRAGNHGQVTVGVSGRYFRKPYTAVAPESAVPQPAPAPLPALPDDTPAPRDANP